MKMKRILIIVATLFIAALPAQAGEADLVMMNGKIYTVDASRSWAQAIAIEDGRILAVGTNAEIDSLVGGSTEIVDLDGRMVMPGIVDTHTHTIGGRRH